ncbi:MAG TPA: peptidoglycan-binding protein [Coleofasciculaceae cyanobacterium]|jgi:peptidoglycan L-alanyl-D-glutamate endopeptidase CwlK
MPVPVPGQEERVLIKSGDSGDAVRVIQDKLKRLGFDPGAMDGIYGGKTVNAVYSFQSAWGMKPTGVIDPPTLYALGYQVDEPTPPARQPGDDWTVEKVARMFPGAPVENIRKYLPAVLSALASFGLSDPAMTLAALATIRAESAGFEPIGEYVSTYNTTPGKRPFGLYDFRKDLGNQATGDGERYKGRGFVQLTGRFNYEKFSKLLGLGDLLLRQPEHANDPEIAASLLACFLKSKEAVIRKALALGDLASARKAVNGGSHGLERFVTAYQTGAHLAGLA